MTTTAKPAGDRRIHKTQRALHESLIALIREKEYDDITVQEILDRADVGRSTFYTHFRGKNELLMSGVHDMLRSVTAAAQSVSVSRRPEPFTWFSLRIFEHHEQHRHTGTGKMGAKARAILHGHLRRQLARLIREELGRSACGGTSAKQLPPALLADYIASTFILVLNWWLDTRSRLGPTDVNELFRSLVIPTLEAV